MQIAQSSLFPAPEQKVPTAGKVHSSHPRHITARLLCPTARGSVCIQVDRRIGKRGRSALALQANRSSNILRPSRASTSSAAVGVQDIAAALKKYIGNDDARCHSIASEVLSAAVQNAATRNAVPTSGVAPMAGVEPIAKGLASVALSRKDPASPSLSTRQPTK